MRKASATHVRISQPGFRPCPERALLPALLVVIALVTSACGGAGSEPAQVKPPGPIERVDDFTSGDHGWASGQADYSPETAPPDAVTALRPLPAPFAGIGLYSAGTNRSDDLLLYIQRRVVGLQPGGLYRIGVTVEFLTDTPSGCVGVGGAPGESVWIMVAASGFEPLSVFNGTDYRLNIERGNQAQSGPQGLVLGNLSNTVPECGARRWENKRLSTPTPSPLTVQADAQGHAWIVVGFDSGFESFSQLYYQQVRLTFTPM